MRFYDPEKQMLAMLVERLHEDAEKTGESPAQILAKAFRGLGSGRKEALRLPDALIDPTATAEERYAWLCAQMDAFHEIEAMRRAEWRMATEQTGLSVLDALIDDPELPRTCVLVRENSDSVLLATELDESIVCGYRLQNAHIGGGLGVPVLRATMELSTHFSGRLSLSAMSSVGEVQITFAQAEAVTLFYDYSVPADPSSVLLLPYVRVSYCLHNLLRKALRKEKTPLSVGEEALLPLALGGSFFCGKTDSLVMAEELAPGCGHLWLSRLRYFFPVAAKALWDLTRDCEDAEAMSILKPVRRSAGWTDCKRALRRFGDYCASANGERICRAVLARIAEATACYPPSLLSGEQTERYPLAMQTVDRVMAERGYTGAWPHYRKTARLKESSLFCVGGVYPRIALPGTRVLSLVDCVTFLHGDSLCVRFSSGTILLKKTEAEVDYLDADSAAFSAKRSRRIQQFAAGLVLHEADRPAQLDLAQTTVCAAKSAELETLDPDERLRVVYASRRPLWVAALLWLVVGLVAGVGVGLLALLARGACGLLNVAVPAFLAPFPIGAICGGAVFLALLLLTILGRRKL